jgi:hypothetical protein
MPKTAALAVASSRGFGQFTGGRFSLTTVTFTSSTTWTAPAYLTNIVSMTGYGSNATSDDYTTDTGSTTIYRATRGLSSGGSSTTHDWSEIYNNLQAWISFINTGTPGTRSAGAQPDFQGNLYIINSDNTYSQFSTPPTPGYGSSASIYFQIGTGTNVSDFSVPSSGTITYANTPVSNGNVRVGCTLVYLGANGSASTGFGQTFPGGTYNFSTGIGGSAPTTNFSNVAVTPGTSYSIVVAGQISISYLAPA